MREGGGEEEGEGRTAVDCTSVLRSVLSKGSFRWIRMNDFQKIVVMFRISTIYIDKDGLMKTLL